jgi:hypothetical protein
MMSCLNGYYQDVAQPCLAEALLGADGGAVAVWASSGMTEPFGQTQLNMEFYRLLFVQRMTLGQAAAVAKLAVGDTDVRRTWILFGDPATRLKY